MLNQSQIVRGVCFASPLKLYPGGCVRGEDLFALKFMSLTIKQFPCFKGEKMHKHSNRWILIEPLVSESLLRRYYSHICRGECDLNCNSVFREKEKKTEKLWIIKEFQINTCQHPAKKKWRMIGMRALRTECRARKLNSSQMASAGVAHLAYRAVSARKH